MLKRDIKRWDLVLLMINIIIGAGIFGLPSKIFELTGVYSIPAIFICALLMIIIILNFSEVASQFNKTGGPYLYTTKAFGKSLGYIIGWLSLVSRIAAYAALINLLVDYLSYINVAFNNQSFRFLTIILITSMIFLINYRGVKNSSRLNNILAIAKLIPLFIFIIVGFYFIDFDFPGKNTIQTGRPGSFTKNDLASLVRIFALVAGNHFQLGSFQFIKD